MSDARIAEIFVPYHSGKPRFFDIEDHSFLLETLSVRDCPLNRGKEQRVLVPIYGSVVCKEVRDRGLAWKSHTRSRRGEELSIWGVLNAANYNYVITWTFRDDGAVSGDVGATGVNYASRALEDHTHNITWRLDVDLDSGYNSVRLSTHARNSTAGTAVDRESLISTEIGIQWDPALFQSVNVYDRALNNQRGHASSYRLMPLRSGNLREPEPYTSADIWVTRWNDREFTPRKLPSYIIPAEDVTNTDVVLWYSSPLHHTVRDEDGTIQGALFSGVTQLMSTGFMLVPFDLFDGPPLYP